MCETCSHIGSNPGDRHVGGDDLYIHLNISEATAVVRDPYHKAVETVTGKIGIRGIGGKT